MTEAEAEGPVGHSLGDGRIAVAVERPRTQADLAECLRERVREGMAIYPQGGRTSLESGGPPARPGVAVDLTGLDRVVEYPAADMTVTVEAGIALDALQAVLAEQGQRLNLEAPHAPRATLGGIYATDSSGPRRFGHGRPRDQVIGVTFATSAGELVKGGGRVVKNVAGYDFPKLLTGSYGTLGVITQLTLKVRPRPEASVLVAFAFEDVAEAGPALDLINTSATRPVAIELVNHRAAKLVGLPDGPPWLLVLGYEGSRTAVRWQFDQVPKELGKPPLWLAFDGDSGPTADKLVDLQHPEQDDSPSFRLTLPPSRLTEFLATVDRQSWAIHAHAGDGIGWIHALQSIDRDTAIELAGTLRGRLAAWGGNLTVPRCPTDWKDGIGVWGRPTPDRAVADRVRAALDPSGLMNPGRFVGTI